MEPQKTYVSLFAELLSEDDSRKREVLRSAEQWAFKQMLALNPRLAQMWLDKLEAACWNNYLSDMESHDIVSHLENQDGTMGAKWPKEVFLQAIARFDGIPEKKSCYNDNALWVTANMIYSDHARSIAQDMGMDSVLSVSSDKMVLSCYRKAVEKLCDKDRPHFVREYFAMYLC